VAPSHRFRRIGFALFLTALALGCWGPPAPTAPNLADEPPAESPDGPAWFEDITDRAGVNFVHDAGDVSKYFMHQCVGSGCAIADLDGDGRPELLLLTNGGAESISANKLYRQKPDGTFEDASAGSGLDFPGLNMGVAVGDVNNDGRPDLAITRTNGTKLLLNLGGLKFADITVEAGVKNPTWGTSIAFLDFDRDGWLDLFVVNYVNYDPSWPCQSSTGARDYCAPKVFQGTASKLFRNRGAELAKRPNPKNPSAAFEDVTVASRIGEKPGPGLGVAAFDADGDGWPDVFVANDGQPNHLWINKRDGTFAEEALIRGAACTVTGESFAGMGVAIGDANNDGLIDLYVTHLASETNTLWKQAPRGRFRDVSASWGLTATRRRGTGFGTLMADFDNDGWLDLAIANGRVSRQSGGAPKPELALHWQPYGERNQVFANSGDGKFRDISHNSPALCGHHTVARGLACGDVDGDGAPDLLVNAIGEKARLLKGIAPARGHWVAARAFDPALNRDAIGAEVSVRAGGTIRTRPIGSSESFLSAGPAIAHFGLGRSDTVDSFEVIWPDGKREKFPGGPADRRVELRRGAGE